MSETIDSGSIQIRSYTDLLMALRARAMELGLTNATIDELSGVQPGYAGKVLGASFVKALGPMSFGAILGALGVKLRLEIDEAALNKIIDRAVRSEKTKRILATAGKRRRNGPLGKSVIERVLKSHIRRFAKEGARARNQKLSPRRRSQLARRAVRARWRRRRGATV